MNFRTSSNPPTFWTTERSSKASAKRGFTLIELLVVIAIISILTGIMGGNFLRSRMRARDTERKANLRDLRNALELYFNDNGRYPTQVTGSTGNGQISTYAWGQDAFTNEENGHSETVYMELLPGDPQMPTYQYHYEVDETRTKYWLYARLENEEDIDAATVYTGEICSANDSSEDSYCNYRVTSHTVAE